jgi:hypothetical protein
MSRPEEEGRSRRSVLLRRGVPVLVLALLAGLAVLLLPRGGGEADGTAADPATTTAADPSGAPAGSDPAEDPAEATPTEPPAPATEAQAAPVAVREGVAESERTVQVAPAAFTAPAEWSDGATVRLVEAHQQVSTGTGPGALAGQPQTVFTLELVNGSTTALDLNAVIVQATYGSQAVQATPLYDVATVDFGGAAEPGATATAVYSFAIPADQLGEVTLSVDVDGHRFPAVFTGAVPAS